MWRPTEVTPKEREREGGGEGEGGRGDRRRGIEERRAGETRRENN